VEECAIETGVVDKLEVKFFFSPNHMTRMRFNFELQYFVYSAKLTHVRFYLGEKFNAGFIVTIGWRRINKAVQPFNLV